MANAIGGAQKNPHVKDRFSFVATKHRALRTVTGGDQHRQTWPDGSITISGVTVYLDCGHSYPGSNHHTHPVGDRAMCYECGRIAAMELPEFAGYTAEELGLV